MSLIHYHAASMYVMNQIPTASRKERKMYQMFPDVKRHNRTLFLYLGNPAYRKGGNHALIPLLALSSSKPNQLQFIQWELTDRDKVWDFGSACVGVGNLKFRDMRHGTAASFNWRIGQIDHIVWKFWDLLPKESGERFVRLALHSLKSGIRVAMDLRHDELHQRGLAILQMMT